MVAYEEIDAEISSSLLMTSAFFSMESPDVVISFGRDFGEGSITESVQSFIWNRCISTGDLKLQGTYLKRFLKKLISEVESSGGSVLDELYEHYASYMVSAQDDEANKGNARVLKTISFLFPNGYSGLGNCQQSRKLDIQLQCSVNMLEGDTGCSIWPSSLFLSEFILSFPEIFANKCCFEVGAGVGMVGVCLAHVKASKVILSDGDFSTLANMKLNLELNNLSTGNQTLNDSVNPNMVHCVCLPWESAQDDVLCAFAPDIILGADVIYNPSCLPHLVRVLAVLLKYHDRSQGSEMSNAPVAYIASVIRNKDTFDYFLSLSKLANLEVRDLTENVRVFSFLPYLKSYPRSTIRLFMLKKLP